MQPKLISPKPWPTTLSYSRPIAIGAGCASNKNRLPAAVGDFTEAITLNPHLPMAYVYRGSALQKLGDLKGAVRGLQRRHCLRRTPGLPYCYRSAAYQSQGDRERAIADLETASARLVAQGDHHILSSSPAAV